jgi:hypothetical protein
MKWRNKVWIGSALLAALGGAAVVAGPSATRNLWGDQIKRADGSGTISLPATTTTLCGTDEACELSNKSISDELIFTELGSTPATPAAGKQAIYPSTDGKFYRIDDTGAVSELGSGTGSGAFSVITGDESDFETSDGAWTVYKDAAAATPADMTGTTATPALTCARSTGAPLMRGDGYLLITHDGSGSLQGEGCSLAFSIDAGDKNKAFYWRQMISSTAATDEVEIYAYDVDNAALITPRCSGTNSVWTCSVQLTDSSNYRIGFHVAGTGTSAWTIKADEIKLAEEAIVDAPIKQYLGALTTTCSWVSNTTCTGKYWRDDEWLYAEVTASVSGGSPTAADLTFTLPLGLEIDTNKLSLTGEIRHVGSVRFFDSSGASNASRLYGQARPVTSTTIRADSMDNTAATDHWADAISSTFPVAVADGDRVFMTYRVPILEWSNSSALMSTSALMNQSAGVVAYRNAAANHTSSGNWQAVTLDAEVSDDHGEFDTSTGTFTANHARYVTLSGQTSFSTFSGVTVAIGCRIKVNGVEVIQGQYSGRSSDSYAPCPAQRRWVNVGDTITMEARQTDSASEAYQVGSAAYNFLSIQSEPNFTVYGAYKDRYRITERYSMTRVTGSAPAAPGEYRSYLRNAGAGTFTETNGAPTASPTAADGFAIYGGNAYTAADTNAEPSKYDIFVGKNKRVSFEWYLSTGRTGFVDATTFTNATNDFGIRKNYDPTTGIVTLIGTRINTGAAVHFCGVPDGGASSVKDCFFDIVVED